MDHQQDQQRHTVIVSASRDRARLNLLTSHLGLRILSSTIMLVQLENTLRLRRK